MAVQDDAREKVMVQLFNLKQEVDRARHDPDAYLVHKGQKFLFELKSTTTGTLSTVRDFGPDHISKWVDMHWIVGFFEKTKTDYPMYCHYLTPLDIKRWTDEKWAYVKIDFLFADVAAERITIDDVYALVGRKSVYSLKDAKALQKDQYSSADYASKIDVHESGLSSERFEALVAPFTSRDWLAAQFGKKQIYSADDLRILVEYQADPSKIAAALASDAKLTRENAHKVLPPYNLETLDERLNTPKSVRQACDLLSWPATQTGGRRCIDVTPGYSPNAMLEIFRDRCRYLIRRGSTLNNPHIPASFFQKFEKITDEHASHLRDALDIYLTSNPPPELQGTED